MEDLNEAGGVYAVMNELNKLNLLHTDCITVTGKTVGENIKNCVNLDPQVIRPVEDPYSKTGGIAVLRGNLAPDGGVVKRSAVAPEMLVHEGPAKVFESEEEAQAAINAGKIQAGDVVVIRYEGPKGGPGMREMLNPPSAIMVSRSDPPPARRARRRRGGPGRTARQQMSAGTAGRHPRTRTASSGYTVLNPYSTSIE